MTQTCAKHNIRNTILLSLVTSCAHQFLSIIVLMATKEMYNNLKPEDRHRMSLLYYYSTSIPPLSLHFTVLSLPLFGNHLKIWGKVLVFTSTDAAALMKSWRSYVSNFRKISNLQLASFSRNVFILFYFGFFLKQKHGNTTLNLGIFSYF